METADEDVVPQGAATFLVPSCRVPGCFYLVDISNIKRPTCSCRHGETRPRGTGAHCRHIRKVILYIRRKAHEN